MKIKEINVATPFANTFLDYPDPISNAMIVYMMGCDGNCKGCQNPQFKNKNYDFCTEKFKPSVLEREIINSLKRNRTNKLVFSGGDPLAKNNILFTKSFTQNHSRHIDICIYTWHDIEFVKKNGIKGFRFIKCGKFDQKLFQGSEKLDEYIKLASKNQIIYNHNYVPLSKDGVYYFKDEGGDTHV